MTLKYHVEGHPRGSGPLIWVLRENGRLGLEFSEVDSVFLKKVSAG